MKNAPNNYRIVIDTNVFISSIVFGSKPRELIDLIANDVLTLVANDVLTLVIAQDLLTEIRRIIVAKFPSFLTDFLKVEKLLESDTILIQLGDITVSVSRDPDDNKFIEAALIGDCNYLVSGDKDLLDLEKYRGVKIVSVSEFLQLISN